MKEKQPNAEDARSDDKGKLPNRNTARSTDKEKRPHRSTARSDDLLQIWGSRPAARVSGSSPGVSRVLAEAAAGAESLSRTVKTPAEKVKTEYANSASFPVPGPESRGTTGST